MHEVGLQGLKTLEAARLRETERVQTFVKLFAGVTPSQVHPAFVTLVTTAV